MSPDVTPYQAVREQVAEALYSVVQSGEKGLKLLPKAITRALEVEVWKERMIPRAVNGERLVSFPSFKAYVIALPPAGLGADIEIILSLLNGKKNLKARVLFEQAIQAENRPGQRNDLVSIRNKVEQLKRPAGTTEAYALRRLRATRPDLLQRVIAGELSANAAMIEAGFRRRVLTVPDDLPSAITRLIDYFGREAFFAAVKQVKR